jgi:hypothetical protein
VVLTVFAVAIATTIDCGWVPDFRRTRDIIVARNHTGSFPRTANGYLVAFDIDRDDWQMFRADREREPRPASGRCGLHRLPAATPGEYAGSAHRPHLHPSSGRDPAPNDGGCGPSLRNQSGGLGAIDDRRAAALPATPDSRSISPHHEVANPLGPGVSLPLATTRAGPAHAISGARVPRSHPPPTGWRCRPTNTRPRAGPLRCAGPALVPGDARPARSPRSGRAL